MRVNSPIDQYNFLLKLTLLIINEESLITRLRKYL